MSSNFLSARDGLYEEPTDIRRVLTPDEVFGRFEDHIGPYQKKSLEKNKGAERNTSDLTMLGLILAEESGEVAAAILDLDPSYIQKNGRRHRQLEQELHDVLGIVCNIASAAGINLGI